MPAQKHIHKYRRQKLGENYTVYTCVLPDCTHYLPAHRIVGKQSICWVCSRVHTIYQDSNGVLARPHCKTCTKRKKGRAFDFPIPAILP